MTKSLGGFLPVAVGLAFLHVGLLKTKNPLFSAVLTRHMTTEVFVIPQTTTPGDLVEIKNNRDTERESSFFEARFDRLNNAKGKK